MTTGLWRSPGVPHKGWTCVNVEDLGEPAATCEMCEVQEIRYVHRMTHPEWDTGLAVGCVCAGNMEEDLVGARNRERLAKNHFRSMARQKAAWSKQWWRISDAGNAWTVSRGYVVAVVPVAAGGWSLRVKRDGADTWRVGQVTYTTQEAARASAFDALVWMRKKEQ